MADASTLSFCLAASATAICCLCAIWAIRSKSSATRSKNKASKRKKKPCGCSCSCGANSVDMGSLVDEHVNGEVSGKEKSREASGTAAERQAGGSMMEQLVPEITTHALSYLDCPSLCRLSMTNSSMRRAANDDNAWKALYHKDFTLEQDNITPSNGWKSYYATTKAVVNINTEFYNIMNERSLPAMGRLWLNADYVKCIHSSGERFTGYVAVMNSWALSFNLGVSIEVQDVRVRVMGDMAWVTMKAFVNVGSFNVTNIFEFQRGRWYIVHHHSSVVFDAEMGQHELFV